MPVKEIVVTVKIEASTPARAKDKAKLMQAISDLPAEHQQRIIALATNPKALKGLADNWTMLEPMFK